ncbi:RNA recognition motif (RRM)-containing protein [Galdieria sulphuraria]|uniref:RNA recognition motif (RRM)-containing protein n=1 Tax=Galdieria sulphuraria TaxID=130081 RepID=M2Y9A5_GALSU|nr:RNA recognition motif (RRM)-containing protein [Galdieria sulphuraria]EME32434.1 RNA recognition motif (RRM)-containing protein [Galdieria sulphuraria]|eukprot:XP_005708954.1 RNA recognition motif (RRM)-containing protein [Galdieria sulphuraria]
MSCYHHYWSSIHLHRHLPATCFVDSWSFSHKKTKESIFRRKQKFLGVGFYNLFYSRVCHWKNGLVHTGRKENNFPGILYNNSQHYRKTNMMTETFIQCPECGTIYSVQVEELESQRAVRCGDCLHEWLATEDDLLEIDPVYVNSLLLEREEQIKENGSFGKWQVEKDSKVLSSLQDADSTEALQGEDLKKKAAQSRKREGEKVLFVGNLSYKASEKDLFRVFSSCGQVFDVRIPRNHSKVHRGFAFIRMNLTGASTALQSLQGANIVGRPIVLSESITQEKTSQQEEENEESNHERTETSLDDEVLEEDWDTDFGPDEQLLGQEAYSNGLRFYLRGSTPRKSPNGKN